MSAIKQTSVPVFSDSVAAPFSGVSRLSARTLGFYLALGAALTFFALPIVWMAGIAFTPSGEYVSDSLSLLPAHPTLAHFEALWRDGFPGRLANTLIVAVGATLLALSLGFLASYALVRFRFPRRLDHAFLLLVLVIKMMPPIVVAIPLFQLLKGLGLLDSKLGLILVYQVYTLPFCIWMLLSFVRDVPLSLEEAASLEGAGLLRRLWHIVLPLCGPGLAATFIFTLIMAWNEFLFALLYLSTPSHFTLPLYVSNFITENETFWGQLMGIGLLSSLPMLLMAGYVQRYLLRGFAMQMK
ncbi:carbohydrate ABC transporter permease [Hahella sp. CR1]|uniref:carbohydrate ABC transporter permease n=1 Tax=Hahella sp. CR1 TaxID=2992807 RepID=UPI0024430127|nr:carbohydrate ABC transporter permease [Hahella sp. CR1]MDG9672060.1 carbohydrate ABC transporter permease [Hahella sp. CR1]